MKLLQIILLIISFGITVSSFSQDRFDEIKHSLDKLSAEVPGLSESVELSVSGAPIQEFVRGMASAHNLNVSIDPSLKVNVVNNFSNAKVSDVLLFLCRQYELDITFIGSIMSFTKYKSPPAKPKVYRPKRLNISYADQTDFLSLDLKKDSLDQVVKEITRQSSKNVVLAPGLENNLVSVYIQNRPFKNTLEKMAYANGLKVSSTDDNFFLIQREDVEVTAERSSKNSSRGRNQEKKSSYKANNDPSLDIEISSTDLLTVVAKNVPLVDIIDAVSSEVLKSYFLFSEPKGNATLYIENATYDDFMTYLLNGSDYTYKVEEKVYLIGERRLERLRTTEMVQLQNRTVESIIDFIPEELKKDIEIKEFLELNSLILSGSTPQIHEVKKFIRDVDIIVPVILIDVMLVDVNKSKTLKTGINFGVGSSPSESAGTGSLFPAVNFDVSTGAVNDVLGLFNGAGLVNLGKVSPNFYFNIDALESEGILKKKSTPKLATLNGHDASLSIGETDYYAEVSNNIIGTQNPTVATSQVFKPLQADLEIKITPIVSGDDQVTMSISVNQSDFKEKGEPNAPRGTVKVGFESSIRVRNQETILLGGLEVKSFENSGRGLPLLTRIPVLKWIFSNRETSRSNSKLHILIKPTIIY